MTELIAKEGYYLTQKEIDNEDNRLFVRAVKGANATQEFWREASQSEKDKWDEAHPVEMPMPMD